MNSNYTAVIKQDADWWIGWIEEVPGVNCQESTREKLLESLRETLAEAIELNRADDALEAVGYGYLLRVHGLEYPSGRAWTGECCPVFL